MTLPKKLSLLCLLALGSLAATAQSGVADWYIYPLGGADIDQVIQTPDKVYYRMGTGIFSYDYDNAESYSYTTRNKLSDSEVQQIYYNPDGKYLTIVYANSNIDLLYDNGRVVNLPEIKDALLTTTKRINDVAFSDGRIAVATDFGIVLFDDKRHEVIESGQYGRKIEAIDITPEHLVLYSNYHMYHAPVNMRHTSFDKFTELGGLAVTDFYVADGYLVYTTSVEIDGKKQLARRTLDLNANTWGAYEYSNIPYSGEFQTYQGGRYLNTTDNRLVLISPDAQYTLVDLPAQVADNKVATWQPSRIWAANSDGVTYIDIASTPTVLVDRTVPEGTLTCSDVAFLVPSKDFKRLYVSNLGPTAIPTKTWGYGDGTGLPQTTDIIEDGKTRCVSLKVASATGHTATEQKNHNSTRMYGGITKIVEDPDDPSIYYAGNGLEGVYVIKDGVEIGKFNNTNSPMVTTWQTRVFDLNLDPEGNLWVGHMSTLGNACYVILPAAKRRQDPKTITKADWLKVDALNDISIGQKDMESIICRKSNMVITFNAGYNSGVGILDTKGTYSDTSDDTATDFYPSFVDTDGKNFSSPYYLCGVEDQKGRVWLGTMTGVIEITNPAEATTPFMPIKRLKVPRNDGTNYADYLLESDQVNSIAVDPSNRKWIATQASGVYLVSEDGDKILEHFTTDNSYLPCNNVNVVYCDPLSNKVYFGTSLGLVSYTSNSAPAATDYSDVYAYPNPVRPDYTGWITVTGLMDNSLVKIADAQGNVFFQGRSEGGMISWDGCNPDGQRVKSGVYFVYASQNDNGTSGVVTKIMVVN